MGLELLRCFDPNNEEYYTLYNHSEPDGSLIWTANGTIDKKQTLKSIILDENRKKKYSSLFKLACKYCYEEYILELRNKLSIERLNILCKYCVAREDYLTVYWIKNLLSRYHMIVRIPNHLLSISNMMKQSIVTANVLAVKYFWRAEQHNIHIDSYIKLIRMPDKMFQNQRLSYSRRIQNEYADILFFLLSQLSYQNQQHIFFRNNPEFVLKSLLLNWPWINYFLLTVNAMWDFLPERSFHEIMLIISANAGDGNNSEALLKKVWKSSPNHLKSHLVFSNLNIIQKLFDAGERVTVIQSLQDALENDLVTLDDCINRIEADTYRNMCEEQFREMWANSPNHCKKYLLLHSFDKINSVEILFQLENPKNLIHYLDDASTEEKKSIDSYNVAFFIKVIGCFEFLDKFLRWYFDTNEDLNKFKAEFFEEKYVDLLQFFSKQPDGIYKFKKFIEYFKNETFNLNCYEHILRVVHCGFFQFASIILRSCFQSDIVEFKEEMILSPVVIGSFLQYLRHESDQALYDEVKDVLKWFSPCSKATIEELKSKLDCCFCETFWSDNQMASRRLNSLFHFIDVYVTDYQYFVDFLNDNIDCDDDNDSQSLEENVEEEVKNETS